jgi:hypothetical protein
MVAYPRSQKRDLGHPSICLWDRFEGESRSVPLICFCDRD